MFCIGCCVTSRQVIQVWDRIIRFSECSDAELLDVVHVLLELLDGRSDGMHHNPLVAKSTMLFSGSLGRLSPFKRKAPRVNRFESSELNLHIMECKLGVCNLLVLVLDLLAAEELDKVVSPLLLCRFMGFLGGPNHLGGQRE